MSAKSRRNRATPRMTMGVVLLVAAGLGIALAAYLRTLPIALGAGAAAVVLGAIATRLMYSEILETRLDGAEDLTQQAREYAVISARADAEAKSALAAAEGKVAAAHESLEFLAGMVISFDARISRLKAESLVEAARLAEHQAETASVREQLAASVSTAEQATADVGVLSQRAEAAEARANAAEAQLTDARSKIVELEMTVAEHAAQANLAQRHTA